jgi:chromatin remodeling complex protein RSC6
MEDTVIGANAVVANAVGSLANAVVANAVGSLANAVGANAPEPTLSIETQFTSLCQDLTTCKNHITDLLTKVRLLEKTVLKSNKEYEKGKKKTEVKIQPPSGFDAPVTLSDEMCMFMNKPSGSLCSRIEVSDYMITYISLHKLQDMTNRKKINPDETLRKLLKLKAADEEVTYFNLQKYLNQHIIS